MLAFSSPSEINQQNTQSCTRTFTFCFIFSCIICRNVKHIQLFAKNAAKTAFLEQRYNVNFFFHPDLLLPRFLQNRTVSFTSCSLLRLNCFFRFSYCIIKIQSWETVTVFRDHAPSHRLAALRPRYRHKNVLKYIARDETQIRVLHSKR